MNLIAENDNSPQIKLIIDDKYICSMLRPGLRYNENEKCAEMRENLQVDTSHGKVKACKIKNYIYNIFY